MTPIRVRTVIPVMDIRSRRLGLLVVSLLGFVVRFWYQRTAYLLNDDTGLVLFAASVFLVLGFFEFIDVRPVETYVPTKLY
jgi:hypothetical protein